MDHMAPLTDGVDPDSPVAQAILDTLADDLNTPKAIAGYPYIDPAGFGSAQP